MTVARLFLIGALLHSLSWPVTVSLQDANEEVALAPFAISDPKSNELRQVADQCLENVAAGLAAKGMKVVRRTSLSEKTLQRARPARWAVLGEFEYNEHDKDQIFAELRLMDVSTGDEIHAYFLSDKDPQKVAAMGTSAGERIAGRIREPKGLAVVSRRPRALQKPPESP